MIRIIFVLSLLTYFSLGQEAHSEENKTVKYRQSGRIDFESLLIEGQKKKADYSVVTGNLGEKDLGLLKLRDDFNDLMANDLGEDVK